MIRQRHRLHCFGLFVPALVLSTVFLTPLAAQEPRAQGMPALMGHSYFPLETGNRWIYAVQVTVGSPRTWEVKVKGQQSAGLFRSYFELSGYLKGQDPRLVRPAIFGSLLELGSDNKDYLWYEFGARVGKSWVMDLAPGDGSVCEDGAQLTMGARDEVLSVPAGQFKQVIRIDFMTKCADAGIVREWFAPGVGLIRREESSFAGPVISELVYAEVGDKVYPSAVYSTSIQLSSSRYVNNLMPPVDLSKLPRVRGAFVVRDATDKPGDLVFPSGCVGLMLEVRNQAGTVVLSINTLQNVVCPAVVMRVDLAKEALVVPFSFILADKSGKALPDGPYSLTGTLQTIPAKEPLYPSARAAIQVTSVQ